MTTVFIGGSRAVAKLNALIRTRLEDLIQKACRILIGDANGADRAVQQFLADRGYSKVTVFCMDACRNNIGSWEVHKIHADSSRKDFAYYAAKDIAMAREAKCGVMLWDGRSKGTLHNVLNLIGAGKKVLVYFSPQKAFYKLSTPHDLDSLLALCDRREIERLQSSLPTLTPHTAAQLPLHFHR
ncbi:MAG: hypothetical protein ABSH05_19560 [Bryobacteraceae bacterium]|jgi:hypothetical protein